ncbi:hypothetical protein [Bacillus sp. 03113]|uniref:hypothetical protein n=1 Tax=Bacillus sp. 03113 TaxID=2578211 RepID=UPI00114162A6|nr:hypothetical protein [Bacillus sp. 03113]
MKVLAIFILFLILTTMLSIVMDLLLGIKLTHALFHLLNPFWVMETGEYVMLYGLLLFVIVQQIVLSRKEKTKK